MDKQKMTRVSLKQMLEQNATPMDKFRTYNITDGGNLASIRGKVVVATRKVDDQNFQLGIAFCSPFDNFDRRKGQVMALGRMIKSPIDFKRIPDTMVKKQVAMIIIEVAKMADVHWMEGVEPINLV